MKTILILTNSARLHHVCSGLFPPFGFTRPDVQARLGTAPTVLFNSNDRQLIAAPDSWEGPEWLETLLSSLTGELHLIRHNNAPTPAQWAMIVPVLDRAKATLPLSYGTVGEHEANRDRDQCKPYCWLADLLKAVLSQDQNGVAVWPFDTAWGHLEVHNPIEDLLADQLDYLHGLLSGKRIPAGSALKKAITDAALAHLTEALPTGAVAKENYKSFEGIRDQILALGTEAAITTL